MNISDLIAQLAAVKKQYGNLPVVISSDEEQNTLGDVLDLQVGDITDFDNIISKTIKIGDKVVVIVPTL